VNDNKIQTLITSNIHAIANHVEIFTWDNHHTWMGLRWWSDDFPNKSKMAYSGQI